MYFIVFHLKLVL